MKRHSLFLIWTVIFVAGCIFGPASEQPNSGFTNNATNNTTSNNQTSTNNGTTGTNGQTSPNNATTGTNNQTSSNNGTTACPELPENTAVCDLQFTCSVDATEDCPGCGRCPGTCVSVAGGGVGVCLEQEEIYKDVDGGRAGTDIYASERYLYASRPGSGNGEVLVFEHDGSDTGARLKSPTVLPQESFGTAMVKAGDHLVVTCPGCPIDGAAFGFPIPSTPISGEIASSERFPEAGSLTGDPADDPEFGRSVAALPPFTESPTGFLAGASGMNAVWAIGWGGNPRDEVLTGNTGFGSAVAASSDGFAIMEPATTNAVSIYLGHPFSSAEVPEVVATLPVRGANGATLIMSADGRTLAGTSGDQFFLARNQLGDDWAILLDEAPAAGRYVDVAFAEPLIYVGNENGGLDIYIDLGQRSGLVGTLEFSGAVRVTAIGSVAFVSDPTLQQPVIYRLEPVAAPR